MAICSNTLNISSYFKLPSSKIQRPYHIYQVIQAFTWIIFPYICCAQVMFHNFFRWLRILILYKRSVLEKYPKKKEKSIIANCSFSKCKKCLKKFIKPK